jgi:hypothetical protein
VQICLEEPAMSLPITRPTLALLSAGLWLLHAGCTTNIVYVGAGGAGGGATTITSSSTSSSSGSGGGSGAVDGGGGGAVDGGGGGDGGSSSSSSGTTNPATSLCDCVVADLADQTACIACQQHHCLTQFDACQAGDCAAAVACAHGCANNGPCIAGCLDDYPDFAAFIGCLFLDGCASSCGIAVPITNCPVSDAGPG